MTPEELAKEPCVIEWQPMPVPSDAVLLFRTESGDIFKGSYRRSHYRVKQMKIDEKFLSVVAWAPMPTKTLEDVREEMICPVCDGCGIRSWPT